MPDERLLSDSTLPFIGKPVTLVLTKDAETVRLAAEKVELDIEKLPFLTLKRLTSKDKLLVKSVFLKESTEVEFKNAEWIVQEKTYCQAQEHLYFGTQCSIALPIDKE